MDDQGLSNLLMPVLRAVAEHTEKRTTYLTKREAELVLKILKRQPEIGAWNAYRLSRWYVVQGQEPEETAKADLFVAVFDAEHPEALLEYGDKVGPASVINDLIGSDFAHPPEDDNVET